MMKSQGLAHSLRRDGVAAGFYGIVTEARKAAQVEWLTLFKAAHSCGMALSIPLMERTNPSPKGESNNAT